MKLWANVHPGGDIYIYIYTQRFFFFKCTYTCTNLHNVCRYIIVYRAFAYAVHPSHAASLSRGIWPRLYGMRWWSHTTCWYRPTQKALILLTWLAYWFQLWQCVCYFLCFCPWVNYLGMSIPPPPPPPPPPPTQAQQEVLSRHDCNIVTNPAKTIYAVWNNSSTVLYRDRET